MLMVESVTLYDFIGAAPGFDVLYYQGGDRYHAEPIVGWAVAEFEGQAKAFPLTCEGDWPLDNVRPIMSPDGSIRCGENESWNCIAAWLDTMRNRNIGSALKPELAAPVPPFPRNGDVAVLDNFRHRFQRIPHGSGS
jgi:hypothetical protein